MALIVSIPAPQTIGTPGVYSSQVAKCALLLPDTAYATGGYTVTPGTFGFGQQLVAVNAYPQGMVPSAFIPVYDAAFGKLRFCQLPSTPTGNMIEVASGTNLSSAQITVEVWGY